MVSSDLLGETDTQPEKTNRCRVRESLLCEARGALQPNAPCFINPCFKKPVYLQYQYEVYQQIEVHVFDQDDGDKRDFLGTASFTVPKLLMASQTEGLKIPLTLSGNRTKGYVIIKYEKVSANLKNYFFKVRCSQVKDIEWFSKSDPFLRIYRPSSGGCRP